MLFIDFCDNLDEDYRVDSILTQIMPCIQVRWTLLYLHTLTLSLSLFFSLSHTHPHIAISIRC